MFASFLSRKSAPAKSISMKARQAPLIETYAADPDSGWIVDSATTSPDDVSPDQPIHSQVVFGTGIPASQRIGIHTAVGGNCDYPNPGRVVVGRTGRLPRHHRYASSPTGSAFL